jgi:hypothetical protein
VRPGKIATWFCRGTFYLVLGALVYFTLSNQLNLLKNGIPLVPYPTSIYEVLPIPDTAADPFGIGATGADFSQVYTSALAVRHGQSAYHPADKAYRDRFDRPPAYPPIANWFYVPLSWYPYHKALVYHTVLSFLGFLAAAAWLLYKTGLSRHIVPVAVLTGSFYVLTPIGMAHLERGQFDLLVAITYVLCVSCWLLPGNHFGLAVLCGLLGAIKWSSAPFLCCFAAMCFLVTSRRKRWVFFVIPLVMVLVTVVFWSELKGYWEAVQFYELDATPLGLSLEAHLPRPLAKGMPVIIAGSLATIVLLRGRSPGARARILGSSCLPAALALTNVAVCYQATSYEYHTMTTLAMVPFLVVWTERERWVSCRLKALICTVFALVLVVVFRAYPPGKVIDVTKLNALYALSALLFFGVSLRIALTVPRSVPDDADSDVGGMEAQTV